MGFGHIIKIFKASFLSKLLRVFGFLYVSFTFCERLKNKGWKGFVLDRLDRLERGSFGKTRWVGPGVWELKTKHGSGYRIYYGLDGDTLVILLCGGDKSTQDKDIAKAIKYWEQYNGGQK